MLVEIKCDAFRMNGKNGEIRPPIRFHEGLNTILGTEEADNSIGKTTFLLIIDHCFGGDAYAQSNVKEFVGEHLIFFTFQFDNQKYYFCRPAIRSNIVLICNKDYVALNEITIKDYREWLKKSYWGDVPYGTFRDVVSRFFRISGKGNDTANKPLHNASHKAADAIKILEILFNLYDSVYELRQEYSLAQDRKKTFDKARRMNFVSGTIRSISKLQENEKRIYNLEHERESLIQNTDQDLLKMEMERQEGMTKAEGLLGGLRRQRRNFLARYHVITQNRDNQYVVSDDDIQQLLKFFPNVNIRHIQEVEDFHQTLAGILDQEMDEEEKSLHIIIGEITMKIQELEKELESNKNSLAIPKHFLDRFSEINKEIDELEKQNEAYVKTNKLKDEVREISEMLEDKEGQVLQQIEKAINKQMLKLNEYVYEIQREPPTIHFDSNRNYSFTTPRDEGTGTAYKSLILLDLSILGLTWLPCIAHDSSIFKNIGDAPIDRIMELYHDFSKQIFIAFDKDTSYRNRTSEIVNETAVLKLGANGNELFGWSWAVKKPKN